MARYLESNHKAGSCRREAQNIKNTLTVIIKNTLTV
jgi:hypothetical protein